MNCPACNKLCKTPTECKAYIKRKFTLTTCDICNWVVPDISEPFVEKQDLVYCTPVHTRCSSKCIDYTGNCLLCEKKIETKTPSIPFYRNVVHAACWTSVKLILEEKQQTKPGPCVLCGEEAPALPLCDHPTKFNCSFVHCSHNIHPECQSLMATMTTNSKKVKNMTKQQQDIVTTTYNFCKFCNLKMLNPTIPMEIMCSWCDEPIKKNIYRNTGCKHQFHVKCAYKWMDHNSKCKFCDAEYPVPLLHRVRAYEPPITLDKHCSGCQTTRLKYTNTRCQHQYCEDCMGGSDCKVCGEAFNAYYVKHTNLKKKVLTDETVKKYEGIMKYMEDNRPHIIEDKREDLFQEDTESDDDDELPPEMRCCRCGDGYRFLNIRCDHQYCTKCAYNETECGICQTKFSNTFVQSVSKSCR